MKEKFQKVLNWTLKFLFKAVLIVFLLNTLVIGAWFGFDLVLGYLTEMISALDKSVIIIK